MITDLDAWPNEFLIPKDKHVSVHDGQVVNKGEKIVEGAADPHDILRLQGVEALARYITDEVQDVYRLQGVKINDKHIEVIVRQMLRRVQVIDEPGDTRFIQGEQVERGTAGRERQGALGRKASAGDLRAHAARHHQGVAVRPTRSSPAASFQETTRVLTEAAIMGKARRSAWSSRRTSSSAA